ncbi:hypothetical protein [Halorussus marinus]|nr:hypothetical protein [Halorussus marinus]
MAGSSLSDSLARLEQWWLALERGWRAVAIAALVVGLAVLAP